MQTNQLRRTSGLITAWLITAACLYYVWPPQPCLTLGRGEHLKIVGITPNSRTLVALTKRAQPNVGQVVSSGTPPQYSGWWSGPIQLWDLPSGRRRSVCVPEEACEGPLVEVDPGEVAMLEPNGWSVAPVRPTHFVRSKFLYRHLTYRGSDVLTVLDLESGKTVFQMSDGYNSDAIVSPTGKWFATTRKGEANDESLVIISIDAGQELTPFWQSESPYSSVNFCFSSDDSLLAISFDRNDGEGETQVWRMADRELIAKLNASLYHLAFSSGQTMLAGIGWSGSGESNAVIVFDVTTGTVRRQFPLEKSVLGDDDFCWGENPNRLKFSPDDRFLISYEGLRGALGGQLPPWDFFSQVNVWNLHTGQKTTYEPSESEAAWFVLIDPDVTDEYGSRQTTPNIVCFRKRIVDLSSGRELRRIPENTDPSRLTHDQRIAVLHEQKSSVFYVILSAVAGWGVPLPGWLDVPDRHANLVIYDVRTSRTISKLSDQDQLCWLSPDEKTLVTTSVSGPPAIYVWDFPPSKPVLKPLAWSMLTPLLLMLLRIRSQLRGRNQSQQHVTPAAP